MRKQLFEMRYFETYYFANVIQGIVEDESCAYLLSLEGWGGDLNGSRFVRPFPRWSHLHEFIEYIVDDVFCERQCQGVFDKSGKLKRRQLYIEMATSHYQIKCHSFDDFLKENGRTRSDAFEDDVDEYIQDLRLCGPYDDLVERITEEVFYVSFLNRELLHRFNRLASTYVSDLDHSMLELNSMRLLSRDGVLNRARIPSWAQRAVFYRDRGRCVYCNRDLTNLVTVQNKVHLDHIVPLVASGLNDVSNLQLLCEDCNLTKGGKGVLASRTYERWYDVELSNV